MKQSAHKALVAGVSTAVAVALAMAGFGEMPAESEISNAVIGLFTAAGAGVASGVLTWAKRNRPRE